MKKFLGTYKDYIENIAGLIFIFLVMIVGFLCFDMTAVTAFIQKVGILGPLILILAKAGTMIFAPVSGSPLYPLAGALFGFVPGSIYLALGDFIGSTVSFYISRYFGRKTVERFARGNVPLIDKILSFMETNRGFLIARICFIALPEAVSYAAGLTRITFTRFIITSTLVGILPTVILAGAGSWISLGTNTLSITIIIVLGLLVAIGGGVAFMKMAQNKGVSSDIKKS